MTEATITDTIYFLGNTTTPPTLTGAVVSFTLNDVVEVDGSILDFAKRNMQGFDIAFWEITTFSPILQNFRFEKISVALGQVAYVQPWAEANLLALKGEYGVAIAGFDGVSFVGIMDLLQKHEL